MTYRSSDVREHDRFAALAAPLAARVGWDGVEAIAAAALQISGDHLPAYIGFLQLSAELLDRLLACADRRSAVAVFAMASSIAERYPAPAVHFLQNSPDLFFLLGAEGVRLVAATIERTIALSWQEAVQLAEESIAHCRAMLRVADRRQAIAFWSLLRCMALDRNTPVLPLLQAWPDRLQRLSACTGRETVMAFIDLLVHLAEGHPYIAGHMLQISTELMQRFSVEELEGLGGLIAAADGYSPAAALKLVQSAPMLSERLRRRGDRPTLFGLYALAAQAAADSPGLSERLCEQGPHYIARLGLDGLKRVVGLCRELGRVSQPAAYELWAVGCALIDRIGLQGFSQVGRASRLIADACPQTAASLIRKSPELIDRIGTDGLYAFAAFCRHMAESGSGMAIRFPEQSLALMDRLLARGDRRLVEDIYRVADRLGRQHPMIAYQVLDKSPELIDRIGLAGFEKFCGLASEMAVTSWTTADAFIKAGAGLIDCIGLPDLAQVAAFSLRVAGQNVYTALSLLEKSPHILNRLIKTGGRPLAFDVIALTAGAAQSDGILAAGLLERSPAIIARTGLDGFKQITEWSLRMTVHGNAAAMALTEAGAAILEKTDRRTFDRVADFWLRAGPYCGPDVAARIKACPTHIDALITSGGAGMPGRVYALAGHVAQHNWHAALNLLAQSGDYIAAAGFEGLRLIAAQTVALTTIDPGHAARFASGEGVAFADFMATLPKGLDLEKVKPVLFNYLAALLGYRMEIEAGERPSLAAGNIVLPARVREFQDDEQNFIYYKVMATHLEAHLEYSGFDLDIEQAQPLVQSVRDKYASGPMREGELEDFYRLFPEPLLAEDLITICENYRLEQCLKRDYPALGKQIEWANRHDLKKRRSVNKINNAKQKAVESIAQTLLAGARPGRPAAQNHADMPSVSRILALRSEAADFHDTLKSAAELYFTISDRFDVPYRPIDAVRSRIDQNQIRRHIGNFHKTSRQVMERLDQAAGRQPDGTGGVEARGRDPGEKPNPAGRAPQTGRVPHARSSAEGERQPPPSGAASENNALAHPPAERGSESGDRNGMQFYSAARIENLLRRLFKRKGITPREIEKQLEQLRPDQIGLLLHSLESMDKDVGTLEGEKGTTLYCEWDDGRKKYRDNWCRVREQAVPEGPYEFYRQTTAKYSGLLTAIRREFQMMRPEEWSRSSRQPDGEDIDLDAAVEYFIERKAGLIPSENNYLRIERQRRDIAVAILVDMSKSTHGRTLRCEKEALIVLSEALQEVGDAFAIFGFSGDNRDNVDFYRIKDFEEPYHRQVHKKISGIDSGLENRDGTALRHTIGLMKAREEKSKLIILISDGKPVDKEYAGRYAIEDTRRALIEARCAGIKTFCITVDEKAADYLPRMFSHSSWAVIDDVRRLPEKISRIFARLTGH